MKSIISRTVVLVLKHTVRGRKKDRTTESLPSVAVGITVIKMQVLAEPGR